MTVGELRKLLGGVPDELEVFIPDSMENCGYSTDVIAAPGKGGMYGMDTWKPVFDVSEAKFFVIDFK